MKIEPANYTDHTNRNLLIRVIRESSGARSPGGAASCPKGGAGKRRQIRGHFSQSLNGSSGSAVLTFDRVCSIRTGEEERRGWRSLQAGGSMQQSQLNMQEFIPLIQIGGPGCGACSGAAATGHAVVPTRVNQTQLLAASAAIPTKQPGGWPFVPPAFAHGTISAAAPVRSTRLCSEFFLGFSCRVWRSPWATAEFKVNQGKLR